MSLPEMQRCWVRLMTDQCFREVVADDPDQALADYELTPAERESLVGSLDTGRLVMASELWGLSRLSKVMNGLPLAKLVIAKDLSALSRSYSRALPAPLSHGSSPIDNTEKAYGFLSALWQEGTLGVNYLGELLAFEMMTFRLLSSADAKGSARRCAELNAQLSDPLSVANVGQRVPWCGDHAVLGTFGYDVVALATRVRAGDLPPAATEEQTSVIAVLQPSGRGVLTLRVDPLVADLVERCDGERTAAVVVESVDGKLRGSCLRATGLSLADGIEVLNQLHAKGVLAYRSP